jgi:RNA polymerase sigma-70 factor (ECF subfamily)
MPAAAARAQVAPTVSAATASPTPEATRAARPEGFVLPRRQVGLAFAQSGRIASIAVEEGQAVRAGETGKLELLFDRYHRPLFGYFMRITADRAASEDLVQEVFFRILKYRRSYRPGASFRAWLYQVGRNALADYASRRGGEQPLSDDAAGLSSPETPADRRVQENEEAALLRRALGSLPREKREVLVMSRFLELKYDEIASILDCEVGTVKVRVFRALRELGDRFYALRGERAQ